MAVRRVVAAIDVVINGQRNIDRLATAYDKLNNVGSAATRVLNTVRATSTTTARAIDTLGSAFRSAGSAFGSFVQHIERGRAELDRQGRATRGLTDNILSLTKSMLLFSVLLPVVQLPQRAIESLQQFVQVGGEWQKQMRASNALLRLNEEQFQQYSRDVGQVAIQYGVATDSMGKLNQTAASSVAAIKPNVAELNRLGEAAYDASVALKLTEASARLAYATNTDANEATTTLIQTMATYGLEIENVAAVSDSLFAITDVGNVRFSELENTLPRVTAAMGPLIQQYTKAEDKMNVMNESFAAFAAMTQVMPAEQAATSFSNIFKDIGQMTGKQKELVTTWERIRTAQGLGEDQSLDPTALLKQGPMRALTQLRQIFDLQGPMVTQYVANARRQGNMQPEQALRVTGQMQLMQAYFEDMRAVRGFQNASVELFERAQAKFNEGRTGATAGGVAEMDKSFAAQREKLGSAWTQMQTELFRGVEEPLVAGINPITQMLARLVDDADFKNSSFLVKLRTLGSTLLTSFSNWFATGGRAQIQTVGRDIGTFIGEAITSFFAGGKENVLVEAAQAFSEAFIIGIGKTLPDMLGAVLKSSLTRAIVEMVAIRYVTAGRMPAALSRTLAVAGAGAMEMGPDMLGGGPAGALIPAAGGLIMAGAGVAALRRGARAPIFGRGGIPTALGSVRSLADAKTWADIMANWRRTMAPRTNPGMVPTTGPGWPGFRAIGRGAARIGGGGIVQGLIAGAMGLMDAENDRERWGAIGGGAGTILGGGLGALAGGGVASVLTSLLLGTAGGAAGNWAGGKLYDLFHPGTGRGGGLAEADAPDRVAAAEVFAMGFDQSLAVPLLMEIRDVLIRSGGGTVGGFSTPRAAAPTTGGTGTGRPLSQSFVNQIDTQQLSREQAMAACGPAAATFFARAYGRNPTLKEAYALVSQIQGGDPKDTGGTRGVATLGQALTQMGLQSEVYQGENIDWGRLAENAKAGIPGIVNIGPKGAFPGHYFQIGGYNPENNQFNVGSSGKVISGGSEWMTPEQMMKLGPKLGAIYGLGRTGAATGGGNVTEADIANIPNTAGTGAGPGSAGGAVTINIQNMMNVEHMDGNTDVRALMGQMADILRQMSTGGSVVGQTGIVTP